MIYLVLYLGVLFIGLPLVMMTGHIATMPEDEKEALVEAGKDIAGNIYRARIDCGSHSEPQVMRVHGRSAEDARGKIEAQLRRCSVEILEGETVPLWQEAIRSAY